MKRLALPIFLRLLVFTESGVAQLQKFRAANGVCLTATAIKPRRIDVVTVGRFPMPRGTRFEAHTHVSHQLAWARSGILVVDCGLLFPHL